MKYRDPPNCVLHNELKTNVREGTIKIDKIKIEVIISLRVRVVFEIHI